MSLTGNPTLQFHQSIKDCFRPRGAAWHIHIYRNNAVNSLHRRVVIVKTTTCGTCPKGHDPLRLRHLLINALQNRGELLIDRADNHEKIGLPWAEARQQRAESIDV